MFKTRLTSGFLILAALGAATACNFKYEKSGDSRIQAQETGVGYDQIYASILKPKCLGCHASKAPVLTTYAAVAENAEAIFDAVLVKHTMPKRGPLSDELQNMLRDWIAAGTPRDGAPPSPPSNTGAVARPYTFANLKTDVLEAKCNTCHSTGNQTGLTPLDRYESVLSVQEWLQPLIFGVIDGKAIPAENLMPPAKDAAPMTEEDKALVLLWYADGKRDANGVPAPVPSPSPSPFPSPGVNL